MTPVPVVSVVIPSYNQPPGFLRECLQSVHRQTFENWEAIVVDDASAVPHVESVIAELGDPRIRLLRHARNRGEGAARNTGISAAESQLIASLDADDRWALDYLDASLDALGRQPDANWVLTDSKLFGASDGTLRFPDPLPPPCPLHFNAGSHGLFRKDLWEKVGGYAEDAFLTGGVDFDFWLSSVERGARVIHVPRVLYWYRTHDASASATSLPYDTYLINDEIWRRHGSLFDSITGCPRCTSERRAAIFRANGYRTSAQAWLGRGERGRAIRLAVRAVSLDPAEPKNVKEFARAVVPRSARSALKAVRRAKARIRAAKSAGKNRA
jgi:glycosyltransferase involved in cell wall biosynthesis